MKINLNVLIFILFSLLVYVTGIINIKIGFPLILLNSIYLVFFYKRNNYILLINIFSLFFYLILIAYFYFEIPYHLYTESITEKRTFHVIFINFLFHNIFTKNLEKKQFNINIDKFRSRNNGSYVLSIMVLVFFIIKILIDSRFNFAALNQSYNIDSFSSTLFEYSIPFLLLSYLTATSSKKVKFTIFINLIFIIIPLLFGRRLPALFNILLFLFFNNYEKVSFKKNIIIVILGFIFIQTIGLFRDFNSIKVNPLNFFLSVDQNGIMTNNFGGILVSSTSYLMLLEKGFFDLFWRVKSFFGHFTGLIIPSSLNIKETYVNVEAMKYTNIPGNGGFASTYLYLWGGILFVIIGALILNYIFRNRNRNNIMFISFVVLVITFPRWYSYNLFPVLKILFWSVIIVNFKHIKIRL